MQEEEFVEKIKQAGGRVFLVGGWVRDTLLGKKPHDKDYVVTSISELVFIELFPQAQKIGKSFPVFILTIDNKKCEVAFGRRERKTGNGHRGFTMEWDEAVSIEEDLYRRDLTANSIALELPEKRLIDPYKGQQDILQGILRPVSKHFSEDPVRSLRAARFVAQLGFMPHRELIFAMSGTAEELKGEPGERIFKELEIALRSDMPSVFFRTLNQADLLRVIFPEIFNLIGKKQPIEYHPEGDAFEHTMLILDKVAEKTKNPVARFAALCHDLGKGNTPEEMLPHHYGHEESGVEVLQVLDKRIPLPANWKKAAIMVIEEHMRAPLLSKAGKILGLMLKLKKYEGTLSLKDFNYIIEADHHSLPIYLAKAEELMAEIFTISGREAPKDLHNKGIGEWIYRQRLSICQSWLQAQQKARVEITE